MEQRNETLYNEGIFIDGPFETAHEKELKPDLVPVPTNSYLGKNIYFLHRDPKRAHTDA